MTGGQNGSVLRHDVYEFRTLETRRPNLLARGAIQRDDRPFDADEDQFRGFYMSSFFTLAACSS
jgi:hypothetical protein